MELTPGAIQAGILGISIFFAGLMVDFLLLSRFLNKKFRWNLAIKRTQNRPWNWYDAATLLLGFLTLTLVMSTLARYTSEDKLNDPVFLFWQMVSLPLLSILIIAAMIFSKRSTIRKAFGIKSKFLMRDTVNGLLCYLGTMPFVMIFSYIYLYILERTGYDVSHQPVIEMLTNPLYPSWLHVTLALLAVLSAPIVEESIFRGILLPLIMKKSEPIMAIVLVSIFFASVHGHLPAMVPIFILAAGLSAGYIVTGSLLVPMVAHAAFNTVSITAFLLVKDAVL